MKLSLEILYTSIKDDGLSHGGNRTCLATLVFEIYRKQKIVGMWLINFVTHCKLSPPQLQLRVDASLELMTSYRNYLWLHNLITSVEKWALYVKHRRKRQRLGLDKEV